MNNFRALTYVTDAMKIQRILNISYGTVDTRQSSGKRLNQNLFSVLFQVHCGGTIDGGLKVVF